MTANTKLETLIVSGNMLAVLDVSKNAILKTLDVYSNQLTNLDVTKNEQLTSLDVGYNRLTTIDLSHLTGLTYLRAPENKLTTTDVSNNKKLNYLDLYCNDLNFLDVSMLQDLNYLTCGENNGLKYLMLRQGQIISNVYPNRAGDYYLPETTEVLVGDQFRIYPEAFDIDASGEIFEIEVLSTKGCHLSSVPDWVSLIGTRKNGPVSTLSFLAGANKSGEDREDRIVLCDDGGTCQSAIVKQEKYEEKLLDWKETDFYHRSLMMCFTDTRAKAHLLMVDAVQTVKFNRPYKLETVSLHSQDDLYYTDLADFIIRFGIGSLPTGVVDCRRLVEGFDDYYYPANQILDAMDETEANYKPATGISFSSAVDGEKIDVDVSVYAKAAESFKITVLLLEDKVNAAQEGAEAGYLHDDITRLTLSETIDGTPFTVSSPDSVVPLHFSGTVPSCCVMANCRVLVFIQRKFGSQKALQESGFGEWYIDNCISGRVGASVPLYLAEGGSSHIGGNEDITPGDDIDF